MSKFTKYETARIIGARALQLAMDAPLLIKIDKNKLKEINFDSLKIAEIEFNANVLPITVNRPLPRKIEGNLIAKKPKKEEISAEKEEFLEKKEMKEIAESEIMELANPEDELEEKWSEEQVVEEEGV